MINKYHVCLFYCNVIFYASNLIWIFISVQIISQGCINISQFRLIYVALISSINYAIKKHLERLK